ncbi:lysophospholipid acyltransferase 5 [Drosophila teissieri]|uniref:lysophospholipid acyltransferase 5 n=1 Tax=Drosophila teissieri TaxID=7243 RepID=UPI001CBA403B|nr:lysophospholipid acyltransferase 5 [Drosophila teissieri]XP_043646798.1 lysophospholipid acyltransferase 5 [Drosophila teissieri]XP_043646799.1 lysophospholipid acyltransferase 5 [Drosophila teissieri]
MAEFAEVLPHNGLMDGIASGVGVPVEALRLLLTILAGYPVAAFYQKFIAIIANKTVHHMFFAGCGAGLCYFNYGRDTYHSLIAILTTYFLVLLVRKKTQIFLAINFVFHMSYLLLGYFYTSSNEYDILWTMPHCILVLRMIGYGFDITDGLKEESELSKDQKETALKEPPSLLELLAFSYFPSGFLVGPQFPFSRYKAFVDGQFRQHEGNVEAGIRRFGAGAFYLIVCQVGLRYLPDSYFLTPEFAQVSFVKRIYFLGFWAKFSLYKYISCWLLTEGALICIGLTYKGEDKNGQPDWSGCSNVKLKLLETGNTMEHYVQSFNVNTNQWVGQYIYKRLKFLNNRTISYGAALGFLAVWHGYHSGYYMTFLMEYMVVSTEKQITRFYTKVVLPQWGHILNHSDIYKLLYFFTLKSYNIVYMGWCLTAFVFLKYERWIVVYGAVSYYGFTVLILWAAFYHTYNHFFRSSSRKEAGEDQKLEDKSTDKLIEEKKPEDKKSE